MEPGLTVAACAARTLVAGAIILTDVRLSSPAPGKNIPSAGYGFMSRVGAL